MKLLIHVANSIPVWKRCHWNLGMDWCHYISHINVSHNYLLMPLYQIYCLVKYVHDAVFRKCVWNLTDIKIVRENFSNFVLECIRCLTTVRQCLRDVSKRTSSWSYGNTFCSSSLLEFAAGISLGVHPASERRCYIVTTSLIGWVGIPRLIPAAVECHCVGIAGKCQKHLTFINVMDICHRYAIVM